MSQRRHLVASFVVTVAMSSGCDTSSQGAGTTGSADEEVIASNPPAPETETETKTETETAIPSDPPAPSATAAASASGTASATAKTVAPTGRQCVRKFAGECVDQNGCLWRSKPGQCIRPLKSNPPRPR